MLSLRAVLGTVMPTVLLASAATVVSTATAAPAHADVSVTTTVDFTDARLVGDYNDFLTLSGGQVLANYSDGHTERVSAGAAVLQQQLPGSSTWTTAETDPEAGYLYFPSVDRFRGNVKYRVYYPGGTWDSATYGKVTAAPSVSRVTQVLTLLNASVVGDSRRRGLYAVFTVAPKAKYKVVVQIKKAGKWRPYAKTRTNAKGKGAVRIGQTSRRGVPYRALINGGSRFTGVKLTFKGTRY